MNVLVNNTSVPYYSFDDTHTVLERYASIIETHVEDLVIVQTIYDSEDVATRVLKMLKVESVKVEETKAKTKPNTKSKKEAKNKKSKESQDKPVKDTDKVQDSLTHQKARVNQIIKSFDDIEKVKTRDYVKDVAFGVDTYEVFLSSKYGNINNVFEEAVLSDSVPFIVYNFIRHHSNNTWYKIQSNERLPSDEILNTRFTREGVILYIEVPNTDELYTLEIHNLERATLSIKNTDTAFVSNILKKTFSDNMTIVSMNHIQSSAKIYVPNVDLDRVVMAEIITNNKQISQLVFISELTQTFSKKRGTIIYYDPAHIVEDPLNKRSKHILKLSVKLTTDNQLMIDITRATSTSHIMAFVKILNVIFTVYINQYDDLLDIYKRMTGHSGKPLKKKKVEKQVKLKEKGVRIKALQNADPFIRGFFADDTDYTTSCQKNYQPYLLNNGNAADEAQVKGIVDKKFNGNMNKVLEFPEDSGYWFACEPREKDDKYPDFIWPYLKTIKNKKGRPEYEAPCCAKINKYGKGGAKKKPASTGYIQAMNKNTREGRCAIVPFNLQRILRLVDVPRITVNLRSNIDSVVRCGVVHSLDSVLMCMEKFRRKLGPMELFKYDSSVVRKKLVKFLKPDIFAYCRQEMYDSTIEEIKDELMDAQLYINPLKYVSLLELYYGCVITYFYYSRDDAEGSMIIPRYKNIHIHRDYIDSDLPRLVILLKPQQLVSSNVGDESKKITRFLQAELLTDISRTNEDPYNFANTELYEELQTILYSSFESYTITSKDVKLNEPFTVVSAE